MKRKIWLLLAVALAGCATPQRSVNILVAFDAAEATRQIQDGSNSLRGSGFMRQQGGGVVTCAGAEVTLTPATAYAKQRMAAIYGSSHTSRSTPAFKPDVPEYYSLSRITRCDAQGSFQFDRVADGDFFVTTVVSWKVDTYYTEGGNLMQRVSLKNGQTGSVVLSQ